jgi:hypothetical protein
VNLPKLRRDPERPPRRLAPAPSDDHSHDFDDEALTDPRFFLVRRFAPGYFSLPRVWQRRIIAAGIALLVLLGVVIGARLTFWLPPVAHWLSGEAKRAVAERLAGAEIVGGVHIGWFGSVRLDDLRLAGAPGSDLPTLSAQEVVVEPSIGALLSGHLRPQSIDLRWVRLHPGAKGEALHELLGRVEAKRSAAAGKPVVPHASGPPPLVQVRDLYVDLPTKNATETATLGPLSFTARWWHEESQLHWDVSGGLLEGKAGHFACRGELDATAGTVKARAELDKLRFVDLPPGWFQGLSMQPLDGSISGDIDGERTTEGAVFGSAHLNTTDLSISWPRLAAVPVAPLDLGVQGSWRWDPAPRTFSFNQGKISLNGGDVDVVTTVALGPPKTIEVDLSVDQLDLQKTIDSLPPALQPPAEAPRVEGSLKAELSFGGPLGDLDDIEIHRADVDLAALRLATKHNPAADFLRRPFRYTPRDNEGAHQSFEVGPENPHYVPYSSLPSYVPRSVTWSEDAGFFGHHGFDFDEIKDSIARDLSTGEAVRGGSTLTQQLVKNLFLSREKTLSRKIREALITLQVEATLPKWRILEIYLNTIEWGPEIYGIGEAAWRYFGVPASRLSPKEAAFLATIIPSPQRFYHLYYERGALTPHWEDRVDHLLSKLHEAGILDDASFMQATSEPLVFRHGGGGGHEVEHQTDTPQASETSHPSRSLWQRLFGK